MTDDEQGEVLHRIEASLNDLNANTRTLADRITVTAKVTRRTLINQLVIAVLVVVVSIFGATQWHRVTGAIQGNTSNAVTICENSNESRAANLELWNYVLGLTEQTADPASKIALEKIKAWVAVLYEPHDCSDLSKKYDIPPPPVLQ